MSIYSYCMFIYLHRASWHSSANLTEVFPWFFLSCKANTRVKPAKTGHGPHSSKIFVLCRSVYCVYVCVCVCVCVNVYLLLPSGGYPIAVNKYIISRWMLWPDVHARCIYIGLTPHACETFVIKRCLLSMIMWVTLEHLSSHSHTHTINVACLATAGDVAGQSV